MERPFYERYPSQYLKKEGADVFTECYFVSEVHDQWLPESEFVIIANIKRFPRYRNKRELDPMIKMFMDSEGYEPSADWKLPVPNEGASFKSLAKYDKPIPEFTDSMVRDMNEAWAWTERHFSLYMGNSEVLTLEQALSRLDMSTSSGVPFNILYAKKKELFEKDPEIVSWLEEDWNSLDENWSCLWMNSLKEEIRPTIKADANRLRTFTAGALDATVHGTRLFANMNEKMYAAHLRTASAVGMSP
jgi:hypothetical protein